MTAWTSHPRIYEPNEVGPIGSTQFPGTVDCCFLYLDSCIVIGELKAPGTIGEDWRNPAQLTTNKSRLRAELRGTHRLLNEQDIYAEKWKKSPDTPIPSVGPVP